MSEHDFVRLSAVEFRRFLEAVMVEPQPRRPTIPMLADRLLFRLRELYPEKRTTLQLAKEFGLDRSKARQALGLLRKRGEATHDGPSHGWFALPPSPWGLRGSEDTE